MLHVINKFTCYSNVLLLSAIVFVGYNHCRLNIRDDPLKAGHAHSVQFSCNCVLDLRF